MKFFYTLRFIFFLTVIFSGCDLYSQNYIWKKGSKAVNQTGVYGTPFVQSPPNNPGGRQDPASWKDASGNFWIFGGYGLDVSNYNELNDLWRYNPSVNEWAFVKGDSLGGVIGSYGVLGVANAGNNPGSREKSASWTDANGNFWLFGGNGFDGNFQQGLLNDLWKYDPALNLWTWMKGSTMIGQGGTYGTLGAGATGNTPGARQGAAYWSDASGNFWLFGGFGFDGADTIGQLGDLWKYNVSANQWTWIKGSNAYDPVGVYGTMGTASSSGNPGGRSFSTAWTDLSGNLWLMGGTGFSTTNFNVGRLNDLWKYKISTNQWTWIRGSNNYNLAGVYGTQGMPSAANDPGSRQSSVGWTDASGNLWLFGGSGYGTSLSSVDHLNDLWQYNIASNTWAWEKGGTTILQTAVYGTQGAASVLNTPGGLSNATGWVDSNGSLWLFGGSGYDTTNISDGLLNNLWKFGSCTTQTVSLIYPSVLCKGDSATLTAAGANSFLWSTAQTGSMISISPAVTTSYVAMSADPNGCGNEATATVLVDSFSGLTASSSNTMACSGSSVTLSASGAISYSWSNTQTGPNIMVLATNTVYTVTGKDSSGCSKTVSVSQAVVICTSILAQEQGILTISVSPNPSAGDFTIDGSSDYTSVTIANTVGQIALKLNYVRSGEQIRTSLPKGIYYITAEDGAHRFYRGKWIID